MADETTTIQISMDNWRRLNNRKQGPSDSFDDVLSRLLNETE
jgi:predicted CopG family antitoxin